MLSCKPLSCMAHKGTLKPKLHLNNNFKLFRNIRHPCVCSLLPNNLVLLSWMSQRNLIHMSFFFVMSSLAIRSHKLNYIPASLFLLGMKEISKKTFKESLGREDMFSDGGSSTTGTLIRWNRVLMPRRWHNLLPSSPGLTIISAAADQYHVVGPGWWAGTGGRPPFGFLTLQDNSFRRCPAARGQGRRESLQSSPNPPAWADRVRVRVQPEH